MGKGKSQLKAGMILSYINMIVGNLIPLFYTPVMLSLLGQSEYGLYKLASSAASYLSLASFGIGAAVSRYIIKAGVEQGKEAEENMFGLFHIIFQIIALLTLVIGIALAFGIQIFYSDSLTAQELFRMRILIIILTVNTAVGFSYTSYSTVVSSHEKFVFLQGVNIISTCAAPCLNLVVLFLGYKSIGMTVSSLALTVLVRILYVFYVRRKLDLRPRYANMPTHLIKEILRFSFWVFIANIVSQLYNATDTMIIGAVPALATVGVAVYNVGATFNNIVFSLANATSGVFTPRANRLVFEGASPEEQTDLVIRIGRLQCLVITLVCSGFVAFGRPFIVWYVGEEYLEAYWVAVLMMIPSCVPLVQSVALSITQAKNMHRFRSLVYLFIAILNVAGTYLMVTNFGIIGAAAVTGAANIIGQGFIMNWYYWKRVKINIPRFWKEILKIVWIPALMCIAALLLGKIIDYYKTANLFAGICVYTAVYCILVWKLSMNRYEKDTILKMLKNAASKIRNIFARS